jgi:hypothetical protein
LWAKQKSITHSASKAAGREPSSLQERLRTRYGVENGCPQLLSTNEWPHVVHTHDLCHRSNAAWYLTNAFLATILFQKKARPQKITKKAITPNQKLLNKYPNLKPSQTESTNPTVTIKIPGEGSVGGLHLWASGVCEKCSDEKLEELEEPSEVPFVVPSS